MSSSSSCLCCVILSSDPVNYILSPDLPKADLGAWFRLISNRPLLSRARRSCQRSSRWQARPTPPAKSRIYTTQCGQNIYVFKREVETICFFSSKDLPKEHSLEDLSGSSNLVSQSCAARAFFASVVVERGVGVDLREILASWKIW